MNKGEEDANIIPPAPTQAGGGKPGPFSLPLRYGSLLHPDFNALLSATAVSRTQTSQWWKQRRREDVSERGKKLVFFQWSRVKGCSRVNKKKKMKKLGSSVAKFTHTLQEILSISIWMFFKIYESYKSWVHFRNPQSYTTESMISSETLESLWL